MTKHDPACAHSCRHDLGAGLGGTGVGDLGAAKTGATVIKYGVLAGGDRARRLLELHLQAARWRRSNYAGDGTLTITHLRTAVQRQIGRCSNPLWCQCGQRGLHECRMAAILGDPERIGVHVFGSYEPGRIGSAAYTAQTEPLTL